MQRPEAASAGGAAAAPPPPGASVAGAVLHELQRRYQKWRLRNINYSRLLAFLSFIVLLLVVLFLQRSSHTSYQVHSTLADSLLPQDPINSVDDVYSWLQGLLRRVWQDPVCGDGVCESPFEYAAYGRFGCRADCGRLQDIQNLTAIRIDLSYDFSHPAGSIPATELMGQASWNLCPAGDSSGCYWTDDQKFDKLTGSTSVVVPDVPDGQWAVVLKRDIFDKCSGAVRIMPLLKQQAQAEKVVVAVAAAAAAHDLERMALLSVVELGSQGGLELVNASLVQQYDAELAAAALLLHTGVLDAASYDADVAAVQAQLEAEQAELVDAAASCSELPFYQPDPALEPVDSWTCEKWLNLTQLVETDQLAALHSLIMGRLAPAAAALDGALAAGLERLRERAPELHAAVATCTGQNASLPAAATASTLAEFYEEPWTAVAPAKAALSSRAISTGGMTAAVLVARAQARIQEMEAAEATVAALPEVQEALNLTQPGGTLPYNYVTWDGGSATYTSCNLQRQVTLACRADATAEGRTPQYVGACAARVACSNATAVDANGKTQVEYSCSNPGQTLSSVTCGDLCDTQNICAAVCECTPACGLEQVCQCDACMQVGSARSDPDFQAMETSAGIATALTAGVLGDPVSSDELEAALAAGGRSADSYAGNVGHEVVRGRRRLQQSSDAMLQTVLDAVSGQQVSQAALQQQVQALQAAVADVSQAAQDTTVQKLIATGQQQIVAGQATIQNMLSEILGKQSAAAAATAAQMQALANLQSLQQQQLAAQAALEQSARDQADAIAIALQQDMLTVSQALELYRRVRLQTLVASKASVLASVPCTTTTIVQHAFDVEQYTEIAVGTSRVRRIGTSNRVIAGLLLFNQRSLPSACSNSRLSGIAGTCRNGLDTAPYGVDPVFKLGTSLYSPDLDSLDVVTALYNCSALAQATYNVSVEGLLGVAAHTTNPPPYCAELFSPRSLPYGFHSATLKQFGQGFPVLFDINLDASTALAWLTFIQEGLYLDSRTQRLLAQVVSYNADLRLFSSALVAFQFAKGGSVQVSHKIRTLRVELYATRLDIFRLLLEVVLTLYILLMAVGELRSMLRVARLTGNPLLYFGSSWQCMDFASTCLLCACVSMWWVLVWRHAIPFTIDLRFKVYADLGADAAYLALADGGAGLHAMHAAFNKLQSLSDKLVWYAALTGINLLMLIARMLQLMDFQPRLGVVTRSLAHAGPDLLHFGLVFGLVFVGYAMLAHLIFGNSIAGFSTFGASVSTCFVLLLGNTGVNSDLQALSGLQGVAGAAFFWTFEILVFLVLLNFLLAIIVDAFGQVKERTTDTTGLHTEVAQMLMHAYHSATSRFSRDQISDAELAKLLHWWHDSERSAADLNGDGLVDEKEALLQDKLQWPKTLRVQGKLVTEAELKTILQAYILDECQGGDIEASRSTQLPGGGLLGSLGLKRQASPSQKGIVSPVPDLDRVAHYIMMRFGEEEHVQEEDQGSGVGGVGGSSSSTEGRQQQQPQQHSLAKQAATAQLSAQPADFSIAAHRGMAQVAAAGSCGAAASGTTGAALPLPAAGSPGSSNGRRLAHAMQSEAEQRGAADASHSLLQVQGLLADAQQRLLDGQKQLLAQHVAVMQAVGRAAGNTEAGSSSHVDTAGWEAVMSHAARASSFRQRSVQRRDSGRAPGLLPPGRPVSSVQRGLLLRLTNTSEEER